VISSGIRTSRDRPACATTPEWRRAAWGYWPSEQEVFGETDYRRTMDILQYYNIILTDCGTEIMHSAMSGVFDLAHTIVLVTSPAIDAARSASATLD
jgi:hypothetical protein